MAAYRINNSDCIWSDNRIGPNIDDKQKTENPASGTYANQLLLRRFVFFLLLGMLLAIKAGSDPFDVIDTYLSVAFLAPVR